MTDIQVPNHRTALAALQTNLKEMLPAAALDVFAADAQALQARHTAVLQRQVGDQAPDFTLSNATNEPINLQMLLRAGRVVLTFYRGTWCPYCNLQLGQLQQILPEIQAAGATLVAISPQTPDASLSMQEKNKLGFEVLSDNGNLVARQYTTVFRNADAPVNAMTDLGLHFDGFYADDSRELPVPATFVIDRAGTITFAQSTGGDYRDRVEPAAILAALRG